MEEFDPEDYFEPRIKDPNEDLYPDEEDIEEDEGGVYGEGYERSLSPLLLLFLVFIMVVLIVLLGALSLFFRLGM